MITAPCKNCTERHSACWDTCEKYKAYKEEKEKSNEMLRGFRSRCVTAKQGRRRKLGGRSLWG